MCVHQKFVKWQQKTKNACLTPTGIQFPNGQWVSGMEMEGEEISIPT